MAIVSVYQNVNMSKGVMGLTQILKDDGIDLMTASPNDFYLFLNSRGTQAKLLARRHYLLHIRKESSIITVKDIKAATDIFSRPIFEKKVHSVPPPAAARETVFQYMGEASL